MARPGIQPLACIPSADTAADLHPTRPCAKGFAGGFFISRTEHDHVPACQIVFSEFPSEP